MKKLKIDCDALEVGDIISFSEFCFDNISGGTGLSNWEYNEKFTGTASGKIVKLWEDYETGWRFIVSPTNQNLIDYLDKNAKKDKKIAFVSEFYLIG